jgi:hypothetical protein
VLHTDGISEASTPAGVELGSERLMSIVVSLGSNLQKDSALNSHLRSKPIVETERIWTTKRSSFWRRTITEGRLRGNINRIRSVSGEA